MERKFITTLEETRLISHPAYITGNPHGQFILELCYEANTKKNIFEVTASDPENSQDVIHNIVSCLEDSMPPGYDVKDCNCELTHIGENLVMYHYHMAIACSDSENSVLFYKRLPC